MCGFNYMGRQALLIGTKHPTLQSYWTTCHQSVKPWPMILLPLPPSHTRIIRFSPLDSRWNTTFKPLKVWKLTFTVAKSDPENIWSIFKVYSTVEVLLVNHFKFRLVVCTCLHVFRMAIILFMWDFLFTIMLLLLLMTVFQYMKGDDLYLFIYFVVQTKAKHCNS